MPTFTFDVAEPGGFTHPAATVTSKDKRADWPAAAGRLAVEWDALSMRRLPEDPPAWHLGKARVEGKGPRRDVLIRPRLPRHNGVDPAPSEAAIAELPPPLGPAAVEKTAPDYSPDYSGCGAAAGSQSSAEPAPPPRPPAPRQEASAAPAAESTARPTCQVGACRNVAACCSFASTVNGRHTGAPYWACREHWFESVSELRVRRDPAGRAGSAAAAP